jgi:hypothetical protein
VEDKSIFFKIRSPVPQGLKMDQGLQPAPNLRTSTYLKLGAGYFIRSPNERFQLAIRTEISLDKRLGVAYKSLTSFLMRTEGFF